MFRLSDGDGVHPARRQSLHQGIADLDHAADDEQGRRRHGLLLHPIRQRGQAGDQDPLPRTVVPLAITAAGVSAGRPASTRRAGDLGDVASPMYMTSVVSGSARLDQLRSSGRSSRQ